MALMANSGPQDPIGTPSRVPSGVASMGVGSSGPLQNAISGRGYPYLDPIWDPI